jgi:hypothetical protein
VRREEVCLQHPRGSSGATVRFFAEMINCRLLPLLCSLFSVEFHVLLKEQPEMKASLDSCLTDRLISECWFIFLEKFVVVHLAKKLFFYGMRGFMTVSSKVHHSILS